MEDSYHFDANPDPGPENGSGFIPSFDTYPDPVKNDTDSDPGEKSSIPGI